MSAEKRRDWRELCEAVRNEKDPQRLLELVAELVRALDERDRRQPSPECSCATSA
jgi:hypothetical protein